MPTLIAEPHSLDVSEYQHALSVWKQCPPELSRSLLYHLPPQGIGTSMVESLSSYVSRLADAHAVPSFTLIREILDPLMPTQQRLYYKLTRYAFQSHGVTSYTQAWIHALEQATQHVDIKRLTLLPWSPLICVRHLLRRQKTWCPHCYTNWQTHQQPLYEPLLWSLNAVTVCPQHHTLLVERCPHEACGRTLPFLSPHYRTGYCAYCCGWLGVSVPGATSTPDRVSPDELARQGWITHSIGEMLAVGPPVPEELALEKFQKMLRHYIKKYADGSIRTFGKMIMTDPQTIYLWSHSRSRITIPQLLNLTYQLNTTPLQLLTDGLENITEHQCRLPLLRSNLFVKVKSLRRRGETTQLRYKLSLLMKQNRSAPPSVAEISRQLNVHQSTLYRHFPNECRQIRQRYLAWQLKKRTDKKRILINLIKQAGVDLKRRGIQPNAYLVANHLQITFTGLNPLFKNAWTAAALDLGIKPL